MPDIIYYNKKIELVDFREKYLLCLTDHFIKFAKCYIIENKESITILTKFKDYVTLYKNPTILHTDIGGEFCSNIFKEYCKRKHY